jgi:hypothetical protein
MFNTTFTVHTPIPGPLPTTSTLLPYTTTTGSDGTGWSTETTEGHPSSYRVDVVKGVSIGVGIAVALLFFLGICYWVVMRRKCPSEDPRNEEAERVRQLALLSGDAASRKRAIDRIVRRPSLSLQRLSRNMSQKAKPPLKSPFNTFMNPFAGSARNGYVDIELDDLSEWQEQPLSGPCKLHQPVGTDNTTFLRGNGTLPPQSTERLEQVAYPKPPPEDSEPLNPDYILPECPKLARCRTPTSPATPLTGANVRQRPHFPIATSITSSSGDTIPRPKFNAPHPKDPGAIYPSHHLYTPRFQPGDVSYNNTSSIARPCSGETVYQDI